MGGQLSAAIDAAAAAVAAAELQKRHQMDLAALHDERVRIQQRMQQLQQTQQNLQEQLRRMQEQEQQIAQEKEELKRQQDLEAALGEKRYEMRTPDDLERMKREARENIGLDSTECNVGIVGQTGTGKSTLTNVICGFALGDPSAAKTGETETTMEMKKYKHPRIPKLAVWDLPGVGTAAHPIRTYFYDNRLYMFDLLVIMYESRFKEDDADLIRQAKAHSVPFVVVRSKAGKALRSRKRMPEHAGKSDDVIVRELIHLFRQNTLDELAKFNSQIDDGYIFVINAWAVTDENESRFQEAQLIEYVCAVARNHPRTVHLFTLNGCRCHVVGAHDSGPVVIVKHPDGSVTIG